MIESMIMKQISSQKLSEIKARNFEDDIKGAQKKLNFDVCERRSSNESDISYLSHLKNYHLN